MNDLAEQRAINLPAELTRQLIAYIGNKRRLLPFLAPILAQAAQEVSEARAESPGSVTFLDPMCGSGAVSRLARHLGFIVAANDWEEFSWAVTAPYLENTPADLERAFSPHGGLHAVLERLNLHGRADDGTRPGQGAQTGASPDRSYIASHFAPVSTLQPRLGQERLFYTAENARFVDRVRNLIDDWFPAGRTPDTDRARRILVALLLYEASNHANTSGVFKAYHRGFGGHGRDALSRILSPMELEYPAIPDGPIGQAYKQDAFAFVAGTHADVCYLDPPYNSHQYGSNYFMLNTIARWDRPPVSSERDEAGDLLEKAGIRADWTDTRSPFCSRRHAPQALAELLGRIDAQVLVVSYSESGVITPESMADLLASHGDLTVHGLDYTAYRGGRQSLTRASSGHELVFVVSRRPNGGSSGRAGAAAISRQLAEWRVRGLLRSRFVPQRLRARFPVEGSGVRLAPSVIAVTADYYQLSDDVDLSEMGTPELELLADGLERARCADHAEEFRVLLAFVRAGNGSAPIRYYESRLLTCLRKFAHRKYRDEFEGAIAELRSELESRPEELRRLADGLERIIDQANRRFGL